jgi:hypothetical protein
VLLTPPDTPQTSTASAALDRTLSMAHAEHSVSRGTAAHGRTDLLCFPALTASAFCCRLRRPIVHTRMSRPIQERSRSSCANHVARETQLCMETPHSAETCTPPSRGVDVQALPGVDETSALCSAKCRPTRDVSRGTGRLPRAEPHRRFLIDAAQSAWVQGINATETSGKLPSCLRKRSQGRSPVAAATR